MIIYLFALLFSAIAAFTVKNNKWIALICVLGLFFITIFRAESVGLDTTNYMRQGLSAYSSGLKTQQFIYAYLTSVMPHGQSHLLIVVFATCTYSGIAIACKRFGVNITAAFFFFILFEFFNLSLNIARQYAAIGFIMVAYSFLYEQNRKKYLFFPFVLLAFGFHSASLVCLPLYFLKNVDFSKINKVVMASILIAIYWLYHSVLKEYYLKSMHTFELTQDIEAYSLYFEQAENFELSLGGFIIATSMLVLSTYIFMRLCRDTSGAVKIFTSLFFVSILMDLFFSELYGNIGRLRYSVNIINVVAYSYYFLNHKDKYKFVVALSVALIYGYNFIHLITGKAYGTTPYVFDFWLF